MKYLYLLIVLLFCSCVKEKQEVELNFMCYGGELSINGNKVAEGDQNFTHQYKQTTRKKIKVSFTVTSFFDTYFICQVKKDGVIVHTEEYRDRYVAYKTKDFEF